jgi:histidinol-phosphatase (PHP family)
VDPRTRETLSPVLAAHVGADGMMRPPALDTAAYLDCVRRCRDLFPDLRIRTGLELSEPHWHPERIAALRAAGDFDRVLGSVHAVPTEDAPMEIDERYLDLPPAQVVRDYLTEAYALASSTADFQVLAHIDFPIRFAPAAAAGWPGAFEEEVRAVLGALAGSGRAFELNTTVPLAADVVGWWRDAGGEAVSFGSDAHEPHLVGGGFAEAAALASACGFGPGDDPAAFWTRRSVR